MCLPSDAVGRRVACEGERGTVRFVGTVPPAAGLWLGVEWDNPDRGKHNGSHEGVHYFTHPKGGSFVRPKKASFGVDYLTAIRRRYEMEVQQVLGEEIQISTRTVEMVCFEAISEKQNKALDHNRLRVPSNPTVRPRAFPCLTVLSLTNCALTWPQVTLLECAPMWPLLEELYVSENDITELQRPNNVLQSLAVLGLSTNPLVDGTVLSIAKVRSSITLPTQTLNLNMSKTGLSTLRFDDALPGKVYIHTFLKTLYFFVFVNGSQWSVINELEKLQSLVRLSRRQNPLLSRERNPGTAMQLLIASVGRLEAPNRWTVRPRPPFNAAAKPGCVH
uniref:Tubulin-specific chaperone E n=1 Tax=Salmo trutta TaxID=8032 RepID=A0A674EGT1_SALTR